MRTQTARPAARTALAGALVAVLTLPVAPALATASPDRPGGADVERADGSPATAGQKDDAQRRQDLRPISPARAFVPGEVLVRFRPGASASSRAAARATVRGSVERRLPIRGVELLAVEGRVEAAVAALQRRPDVVYAEPNYLYRTTATPDDPRWGRLWGLHNTGQSVGGTTGTADADIDAPEAWDVTTGDSAVTVAVVDTGVAYRHPDLAPNIWRNPGEVVNGADDDGNGYVDDVRGWDWADGDRDPDDVNGHGTHVAGTIGAVGDDGRGVAGVAWDVSLMPLRVLDAEGGGSAADVAAAFVYAADKGADVVNVSLDGPEDAQVLEDAILAAPDTLFVVAAGNAGTNNDTTKNYPCSYPAANIVCVAATDNRDQLASFSNHGASAVDLAAPGVGILSTVPHVTLIAEGFGSGWRNRWSRSGTGIMWGVETDAYGPYLSDSPDRRYAPNSNSRLRTATGLDLRGMKECTLDYWLSLDTEDYVDGLLVQGSVGTSSWRDLAGYTGWSEGWVPLRHQLTQFEGKSPVHLRYSLVSDSSIQYDGAFLDDVTVTCRDTTFTRDVYASYDGTSMATPHVAGAAALLHAATPGASVALVRNALLNGADAKPSLAGKTVTGGRLNAKRSLDLMPAAVRFAAATYTTGEGDGVATVTVERTGDVTAPVSVTYATTDGTATNSEDYTATTGQVEIPAGKRTAAFTVPVLDDDVLEGSETVGLALSDPAGASLGTRTSASLSIRDDETPALVSYASTLRTVPENAGVVNVTVTRGGDTTVPAAVSYRRSSGTATAGSDFRLPPGTLQFAAGETTKTFPLTVLNDNAREVTETVVLSLATASPITEVGTKGSMTVRIAPSDQRPDALVSTAQRSGYAGNNVYNTTGRNQTKVAKARRTQVRTFYVRVQNDGNVANTFRVKGSAPRAGSRVTYLIGSTNVTKAMRSKGGLAVRLGRGRSKLVTVRVKVLSTAVIGSRKPVTVRATWTGDGTRADLAKAVVRVVR